MARESDPSLVLEPVVYVRTDSLDLDRVSGGVLAFVAGALFGITIVYQWMVWQEYELFSGDRGLTVRLSLLVAIVAVISGFLMGVSYRYYLRIQFRNLSRRISRSTLGGEATLRWAGGRLRRRPSPFDMVRWTGPPLICARYEPSNEVQEIHATEDMDLFSGARRFESRQPFQWMTVMFLFMTILALFPVVTVFHGPIGTQTLTLAAIISFGILVVLWFSRASTFHRVVPLALSSCVISVGSVQLTRLGRTSTFRRDDSVMIIGPELEGTREPDPRVVRVAVVLVRRDGYTDRMTFRGEANPCIADLIGRWMYGYELPEELAKCIEHGSESEGLSA